MSVQHPTYQLSPDAKSFAARQDRLEVVYKAFFVRYSSQIETVVQEGNCTSVKVQIEVLSKACVRYRVAFLSLDQSCKAKEVRGYRVWTKRLTCVQCIKSFILGRGRGKLNTSSDDSSKMSASTSERGPSCKTSSAESFNSRAACHAASTHLLDTVH